MAAIWMRGVEIIASVMKVMGQICCWSTKRFDLSKVVWPSQTHSNTGASRRSLAQG